MAAPAGAATNGSKIRIHRELSPTDVVTAWVYFTEKGNSNVALSNTAPISGKALLRRAKRGSIANTESFDREVNPVYIDQIQPLVQRIRHESRWLNAVSVEVRASELEQLASLPFVKKITEVARYISLPVPVTEEEVSRKPSDKNPPPYGESYSQLLQIGVTDLHARGLTGAGVTILMLDTGFKISHPAFQSTDIDSTWDFINNDVDVEDSTGNLGQQSHGTETLSTIGGFAYGDVVGAAYGAAFLLAKTERLDNSTPAEIQDADDWVAGIEWGEALGADVVSSSLGYTVQYTYADMDGNTTEVTIAADMAAALGLMVCNSQGNEPTPFVIAPADGDSVIAVGAVNIAGQIASFSVHGPAYDGRIKPDVCALGVNVRVALRTGGYGYGSGTSFSCPLVAGSVALLLESHPDWDYGQLYRALTSTASRAGDPDNIYGHGIIDAALADNVEMAKVENLLAFPNPCSSSVTFAFPVQEPGHVTVQIYTVAAEKVAQLERDVLSATNALIRWDLFNDKGKEVSDGVYIVYVSGPGISKTTKIFKVSD